MVCAKVVLPNKLGLHMRPAGVLCREALKYSCNIKIKKGNSTANAKSILGILATQIRYGDEFELICEGEKEEEALATLVELVKGGMGDDI